MKAGSDDVRVPLAVDLDGTLIRTDLLWESFLVVMRREPWTLLRAPFWWACGRARLKQELGRRATLDPASLPAHEEFVAWLRTEKARGRKLVLATASDAEFAKPVGEYFKLFEEILGSDGRRNLRGVNKGRVLAEKYGERGFDYAGNSSVDLAVWRFARAAVVVNASETLPNRAAKVTTLGPVFPTPRPEGPALWSALDLGRIGINLLVLLPALMVPWEHCVLRWAVLLTAFLAFAFSTSAGALLRALLDVPTDRLEPALRLRPFASGDAPLSRGLSLLTGLAIGAVVLGAITSPGLGLMLTASLALEVAAGYRFRHHVAKDAIATALLALARVAAGAAVVGRLLPGGLVVFLGLAFAAVGAAESRARGGTSLRAVLAHGLGLASGPVLGWFAGTPEAVLHFHRPWLLLLLWPGLLLWIIRGVKSSSELRLQADSRRAWRWVLAGSGIAVWWLAAHV